MTTDLPIFAQATVDQTDLFNRKLSIYLRGQIGKFNYRVIASDPFPISTSGKPPVPISPDHATFARDTHTKQFQGFFVWNFSRHAIGFCDSSYPIPEFPLPRFDAGCYLRETWDRAASAG